MLRMTDMPFQVWMRTCAKTTFGYCVFLTALTVAATHCLWIIYGFNPSTEGTLGILIQASHCGICIFFGLSGYLITSSLTERPNFLNFTVSRIIRLCPLLIFSSLLIAFVFGLFSPPLRFLIIIIIGVFGRMCPLPLFLILI